MPLAMLPYAGLPAFLSEYSLQRNQAAALFARSPRTLRRWIRRGRAPGQVLDLVKIVRDQTVPLSHSYPRELRAATPEWTARLARPRPLSRRRRHLVNIAEGYAANGWIDRAAEALREAWPTASTSECWRAAETMVETERQRQLAAVERRHIERAARRADNMRRYRRRR